MKWSRKILTLWSEFFLPYSPHHGAGLFSHLPFREPGRYRQWRSALGFLHYRNTFVQVKRAAIIAGIESIVGSTDGKGWSASEVKQESKTAFWLNLASGQLKLHGDFKSRKRKPKPKV